MYSWEGGLNKYKQVGGVSIGSFKIWSSERSIPSPNFSFYSKSVLAGHNRNHINGLSNVNAHALYQF